MALIVAILFEENPEESYIAIQLDGAEPEILFTKGPDFTKTMGPYPVPYAEATYKRWSYCVVENPPSIQLSDKKSIRETLLHLRRQTAHTATYFPENS